MSAIDSKKALRIVAGISLFLMIFWNYFANTGEVYGQMIGEISDQYLNLFTPLGYAFSIWGVIYIGMIAIAIGLISGKGHLDELGNSWLLILLGQSLFNALWIHFFLSDEILGSVIMIFLLLFAVIALLVKVRDKDLASWVKWTLGIYAGWVTAASIAAMALYLTSIFWGGWGIDPTTWYKVMTVAAGVIGFLVYASQRSVTYAFAIVWALVAIGFRHTENTGLFYQALIPAFFLFLFVLSRLVRNKVQTH